MKAIKLIALIVTVMAVAGLEARYNQETVHKTETDAQKHAEAKNKGYDSKMQKQKKTQSGSYQVVAVEGGYQVKFVQSEAKKAKRKTKSSQQGESRTHFAGKETYTVVE